MSKVDISVKNKPVYIIVFILTLLMVNPFHYFFRVSKIDFNIFFENLQIISFTIILLLCFLLNLKINQKYLFILFVPFVFLTLENIHYFILNKNYGYKLNKNIFYLSFFYFVFWFSISNIKLDKKT